MITLSGVCVMKKIILALIIIVVLTTFAMPVIAAKEDNGVKAGITVALRKPRQPLPGAGEQDGADDTVTVTPTTRETIEVEHGTASGIDDSKKTSGRTIAQVREDRHKSLESLNATLRI